MNRIKEVLEKKGIKQAWLAEKLGKSFSIVNAYICAIGADQALKPSSILQRYWE